MFPFTRSTMDGVLMPKSTPQKVDSGDTAPYLLSEFLLVTGYFPNSIPRFSLPKATTRMQKQNIVSAVPAIAFA